MVIETTDDRDQAEDFFAKAWPRLFSITYRILREPADVEGVVRDAWTRWQHLAATADFTGFSDLAEIVVSECLDAAVGRRSLRQTIGRRVSRSALIVSRTADVADLDDLLAADVINQAARPRSFWRG